MKVLSCPQEPNVSHEAAGDCDEETYDEPSCYLACLGGYRDPRRYCSNGTLSDVLVANLQRTVETLNASRIQERELLLQLDKKLKVKDHEIKQSKEVHEQLIERDLEIKALRETREFLYLQVASMRAVRSESVRAVEGHLHQAWQDKKRLEEEVEKLRGQVTILKRTTSHSSLESTKPGTPSNLDV